MKDDQRTANAARQSAAAYRRAMTAGNETTIAYQAAERAALAGIATPKQHADARALAIAAARQYNEETERDQAERAADAKEAARTAYAQAREQGENHLAAWHAADDAAHAITKVGQTANAAAGAAADAYHAATRGAQV